METIESRHKLAKQKIKDFVRILLNEDKISSETAKMIFEQVGYIEDDALSLFSIFAPKHFLEFEVGGGESKKKYSAEIIIKER